MKNEELSASPIKNYRIKNRITEETKFDERQKSHCKDFRIIVPVKVQHPGTKGAAPLHQKSGIAILIVEHSYTVGIPMLNCRYQTAILFWYFC